MTRPRCGDVRLYLGDTIPVLYPGEQAHAYVPVEEMIAAAKRGEMKVSVEKWIVEPAPGWYARWLRVRYRLWGQWVHLWRSERGT